MAIIENKITKEHLSKIKAFVFDLDGTLTDSIGQIKRCAKLTFAELALKEPTEKMIESIIGVELSKGLFNIMSKEDKENYPHIDAAELAKTYRHMFTIHKEINETILLCDVRALFIKLKDRGYKIGLASGRSLVGIERFVKDANVSDLVDIISASKPDAPSKPDPYLMNNASLMLNLKQEEILGVGDALIDIQMYKRAGNLAVGVLTGVSTRDDFLTLDNKDKADMIVDRVDDLLLI